MPGSARALPVRSALGYHDPEPVSFDEGGFLGSPSLNGPMVSSCECDGIREVVGKAATPMPGVTLAATTAQPDLAQGAGLIRWERPRGGRVVSLRSIGATVSLAVYPGLAACVRGVRARFGVARLTGVPLTSRPAR